MKRLHSSRLRASRAARCMRLVLVTVILANGIAAGSGAAQEPLRVLASTTWVGAMAEAAGADGVRVLTPAELRHPAEYDFSPRDVGYAAEADLLIWAGYEPFMEGLFEAAGISEDRILRVSTSNVPPRMAEAVRTIAETLGTEVQYERWKRDLDRLAERLRSAAEELGAAEIPVAVHFHQRGFVDWLGFPVVAEFGPAEMTPAQLVRILAQRPAMIIDNWHVPHGEPLRGEGREYTSLINFPGPHGTDDLFDVLQYNAHQLGLF